MRQDSVLIAGGGTGGHLYPGLAVADELRRRRPDLPLQFVGTRAGLEATIVQDDHCTGTRYFWDEVRMNGDPLTAIAERYVARIPCPTKDWPNRRRVEHILGLAKQWDVQGAIVIQQKFCDPHELDIPAIRKSLEGAGVKTLFLELDVTVPVGQFKIRAEAFLEMLAEEDLF